tara:strand:+ start:245 stop:439 length:195 start_codon:yes stop_codon:yes gene_type:complete
LSFLFSLTGVNAFPAEGDKGKVARTMADLDGAGGVRRLHIAEALTYRRRAPGQAEGVHAGALAR